jgi:RHS repeat-associated protein
VQSYQPYSSTAAACDTAPPTGTRSTQHRYDAAHREIAVTLPDGAIYPTPSQAQTNYLPLETDELDPMDTDPKSPFANTPTVRRFNGLGKLTAVGRTLAANQPPSFVTVTYDELGRVSGYVDAGGNRKAQHYDLAGRLLQVDDPNAGTTKLAYDAAGNIVSRTDARGATIKQSYDGANRLSQRWDDANHDTTLTGFLYDQDQSCLKCSNAAGRAVGTVFPAGKDSVGYDVRGRAIYRGRTLDGFTFATLNAYDDRDRLSAVTYPDGRALGRKYDDAGRILAIDGAIANITYDDRGLPSTVDYTNGTTETKSYDDVLRLAAQTIVNASDTLQSLAYQRDRVGNLLSIVDQSPDPTKTQLGATLGYDAWYRTTSVVFGKDTINYKLDALDNVLSASSSLGAMSPAHVGDYHYDGKRPNAAIMAGALPLRYDAAGYVQKRGDTALSWDAFGRLASATLADGDASYSFAAAQERVVSAEPHAVTHHVSVDFEAQDGLGVIYVRLGTERVARLVSNTLAAKLYTDVAPLNTPDGQINAGDAWISNAVANHVLTTSAVPTPADRLLLSSARRILYEAVPVSTWFGHDQLGSITLETDDHGAVSGRRAYTTFGAARMSVGDADRYGFTNQETDATGTVHFAFRQLDSFAGRWQSEDPLFAVSTESDAERLGESTTAYAYVANNPSNAVDPTGLAGTKSSTARSLLKRLPNELHAIIGSSLGRRDLRSYASVFNFLGRLFRNDVNRIERAENGLGRLRELSRTANEQGATFEKYVSESFRPKDQVGALNAIRESLAEILAITGDFGDDLVKTPQLSELKEQYAAFQTYARAAERYSNPNVNRVLRVPTFRRLLLDHPGAQDDASAEENGSQ